MAAPNTDAIAPSRRLLARFGPVAVVLALAVATTSFLIFSDYTPIPTSPSVVLGLFIANIVTILALAILVVLEGLTLFAAWKAGVAGARLHIRIVGLFSIIAAVPVLLMALVGSVTLDRSLNPAFMKDVRGFVKNTIEAATLYQESQCWSLLQEARLTAQDLDSAKAFMTADQTMMFNYFSSRAKFLGFSAAAILRADGSIYSRANIGSGLGAPGTAIVKPSPQDFADAKKNEPTCRLPWAGGACWPRTVWTTSGTAPVIARAATHRPTGELLSHRVLRPWGTGRDGGRSRRDRLTVSGRRGRIKRSRGTCPGRSADEWGRGDCPLNHAKGR